MIAKSARPKRSAAPLRYTKEDLAPRNAAEAEDFADRFIKRNRVALNEALKEARASIKRGQGVDVKSFGEFTEAIAKYRNRKPKRKK
jgi:nucleoid DNA-binding protein